MSIQIEAGKDYRSRSGEHWRNAEPEQGAKHMPKAAWRLTDESGVSYLFEANGAFCTERSDGLNCLVSEWTDEPSEAGRPETDIKVQIADEAKTIVSGARRSAYGTPEQNFERIARFWQAYFENTGRGAVAITAADVSPMMRLMKEARLAETPDHYDSFVDLIGYTLTGAEVNKTKKPT